MDKIYVAPTCMLITIVQDVVMTSDSSAHLVEDIKWTLNPWEEG